MDDETQLDGVADSGEQEMIGFGTGGAGPRAAVPGWSQVWHLPVLVLGLGLFVAGLVMVAPEREAPKWKEALQQAKVLMDAGKLDEARDQLDVVADHLLEADKPTQGRYYQYEADLNYLKVRRQSRSTEVTTEVGRANRELILEGYQKAEEQGWSLEDASLYRVAETLAALDRGEEALAVMEQFEGDARRRHRLVRRLIERELEQPDEADMPRVAELMERFRQEVAKDDDRQRRGEELTWMHKTQAQIRLDAHDTDGAILYLNEAILRLRSSGHEDVSEMYVMLGQAYLDEGDFAEAERRFVYARDRLPSSHPGQARVLMGLADIELVTPEGSLDEAKRLYETAERDFRGSDAHIDALIGLADVEARAQNAEAWARSLEFFRQAIRKLNEQTPIWDRRREFTSTLIQTHVEHLLHMEDYRRALDFLDLIPILHEENVPDELHRTIALAHQRLAEERASAADGVDPRFPGPSETARELIERRGQMRIEAANHFQNAADHYLVFARSQSQTNDEAHGESLWQAAICYDNAQLPRDSIAAYDEFVRTRQSDTRVAEAINKLGRAYMADGQYEAAIEQFERVDRRYPQSAWAADALVPKAQCMIRLEQYDAAGRVLTHVLEDHEAIRPESDQYREALITQGMLHYRLGPEQPGKFEEAFRVLQMAVDRYGDSDDGPRLHYLLADAYRQSVRLLDERILTLQSQSERLAFQAERLHRLESAQSGYREVRQRLDAVAASAMDAREQVYHRNAYFYEADCAYQRDHYEEAVVLYASAASEWQDHPAALVAQVQIVNAYAELGQFDRARVANRHALDLLERLDDSVFDDPTVPMSRRHWEDWLRWTSELELLTNAE